MATQSELRAAARRAARALRTSAARVVFAESCTGGLVSAALTEVPGISDHHCGSAVVYRVETKAAWLGISRSRLERPGPVSRIVAGEMASRVLRRTPEAALAASVTGHLGPHAPPRQDGLIYIGLAGRDGRAVQVLAVHRHRLAQTPVDATLTAGRLRVRRQREAAVLVFAALTDYLTGPR